MTFVDENNTGSDPNFADTDMDGLDDDFEVANNEAGYDPNVDDSASDFDGDASTVTQEIEAGTSVLLADTDGDGFFDGAETGTGEFVSYDFTTNTGNTGTNPLLSDTDGDGLLDGVETNSGTFVGASNTGTNPNSGDTDGDGFSDGDEINFGGDPFVDDEFLPNATVGYAATGSDWFSAFADLDIDGDGALGTDGFVFYGDFSGSQAAGDPYTVNVESSPLPSYLTSHSQGADFTGVAAGFAGYGRIDDPTLLDGADQIAGFALSTSGSAGSTLEVVTFEISGLAAGQIVRVGVLGGVEANTARDDGRWDPAAIILSGPNDYLQAALDLEGNPGGVNAGWVFFDLSDEGTYSVFVTRRLDIGGAGVGGLTFDSTGGGDFLNLTVENNPDGTSLDLSWKSRNGLSYNLLSSTTLETAPSTWDAILTGLTPDVPNATLTIERPVEDVKRFYVIQEVAAPE